MAEGHIKELNEHVDRKSVFFENRYGITLAGELYTAKGMDKSEKNPALVVGAPYGGVKEQGPCVYANELACRGFVVLTFDPCYMGESAGFPRRVSSPDLFSENFSACVDYLGLQRFVDRDRIGAFGICGSGGFAMSAAQMDTRIKAVAASSFFDMSEATRLGQTPESLAERKRQLAERRWKDAEQGYPEYTPSFPENPIPEEEIPAELPDDVSIWWRFYAVPRGHHPAARGGFTTTSDLSFMNYGLLEHMDEIAPRPVMFICGTEAHSRIFSDIAFEKASEPKKYVNVEGANHIDLYDRVDLIPFDEIEEFYRDAFSV